MPITRFLEDHSFEPEQIKAMSWALEEVCNTLRACDDRSREAVATRIIELAKRREHNGVALRDRVLREATLAARADETTIVPWHQQAQRH
jgi:hypothetical protein